MIYQHKILNFEHNSQIEDLEQAFNQLGKQGYRLTAAVDQNYAHFTIYYFVRQISENQMRLEEVKQSIRKSKKYA